MRNRLIIEGNAVYELDEECMKKKQKGQGIGAGGQRPMAQSGRPKGQGSRPGMGS